MPSSENCSLSSTRPPLLRAELDKRRTTGGLTPEQHAEIERIPEYLELTRARWSSAVTLWREFRDELRKEGRR